MMTIVMPDIMARYKPDDDNGDNDDDDDDELDVAYLLRNPPSTKPPAKKTKTRAGIIFSIEDKNGERRQYLGRIDT